MVLGLAMLNKKALIGTASAPPVYVEDVFSTYLYTGNGSTQSINNGIALANGIPVPAGTAMAGGYFAGFISTTADGVATHALIIAPKATGENSSLAWQTSPASTPGTSSVIDGPTNSANMNDAGHPAAQFCEALSIGGYTDWYMPAKNELETCYYFLKPTTTSNDTVSGSNANSVFPEPISTNYTASVPSQTSAQSFLSGSAEAFASSAYWSSTEHSDDTDKAWRQSFSDGNQSNSINKDTPSYVRAVRRIPISDSELDPYRVAGKGGLVWLKSRSAATDNFLFDTTRGALNELNSNNTNAEASLASSLTAFNSNGFSLGSATGINVNAALYCSWTFRKQPKFFDVVTYTGNLSNRTIAHNLGSVPGMIIIKCTTDTEDWVVYHRGLNGGTTPQNYHISLNLTDAEAAVSGYWNDTAPTATEFTLGVNSGSNNTGQSYVAYLFAHDAGGFGAAGTDNVISCGSFTDSNNDGLVTVDLGYEPQFVIIKTSNVGEAAGTDWYMYDNMRGLNVDSNTGILEANTSDAEASTSVNQIALTATGFKTTSLSTSGASFIYMAIRRPMKVPTDATTVFQPVAYTGTNVDNRLVNTGIVTDMILARRRTSTSALGFVAGDRLRGNPVSGTAITSGESLDPDSLMTPTVGYGNSFSAMNGFGVGNDVTRQLNQSSTTQLAYAFQRKPGFFDVVCYTGNATAGRTVTHNLTVAPEMMIIKNRNGGNGPWTVYHKFSSATPEDTFFNLSTTAAAVTTTNGSYWNRTNPTSTVFTLFSSTVNDSADYVAYLFATCPGVSKVGSYTGNGTTQAIACGFTGGARFVLIKRTDSTGDWYVWDTARGIIAGNDPYLLLNSTTAGEVTSTDYIDPSSSGFELSSTAPAAINASGGSYIFLAIA
jgi:hypothetical protein